MAILTVLLFILAIRQSNKNISCQKDKKRKIIQYTFSIGLFLLLIFLLFYPEIIPYFMDWPMKILLTIFALCSVVFASNVSLIKVEGMHCPLCTTAVKKAVKDLDGVEKVSVRLNTKEVTVTYNEKTNLKNILEAIKTTSYEGVEISTTSDK